MGYTKRTLCNILVLSFLITLTSSMADVLNETQSSVKPISTDSIGDDVDMESEAARPIGWPMKYGTTSISGVYKGRGLLANPIKSWSYTLEGTNLFGECLVSGDVDADGRCEIIGYNHSWVEKDGKIQQQWYHMLIFDGNSTDAHIAIPLDSPLSGSPFVHDIDEDAYEEVLFFSGYSLYMIDGPEMALVHLHSLNQSYGYVKAPLICEDIDMDGVVELVFASYNGKFIVIDTQTWQEEWTLDIDDYFIECPLIVDRDGDGFSEIFLASGISWNNLDYYGSKKLYGIDASSRAIFWVYEADSVITTRPCLLGTEDDFTLLSFCTLRNTLVCIAEKHPSPKWNYLPSPGREFDMWQHLTVLDINRDSIADIACGSARWLFMIDGDLGIEIWNRSTGRQNRINAMSWYDYDGDLTHELLVSDDNDIMIIDPGLNRTLLLIPGIAQGATNLMAFSDIDGDRFGELLYKTNSEVMVFDTNLSIALGSFIIDGVEVGTGDQRIFYSDYKDYVFRGHITANFNISLSEHIEINIDIDEEDSTIFVPLNGSEIKFPETKVAIVGWNTAFSPSRSECDIELNMRFCWTFPHERLCSIRVGGSFPNGERDIATYRDCYRVENDMMFSDKMEFWANGTLVPNNSWISGYSAKEAITPYVCYEGARELVVNTTYYTLQLSSSEGRVNGIPGGDHQSRIGIDVGQERNSSLRVALQLSGVPLGSTPPPTMELDFRMDWEAPKFLREWPTSGSLLATAQVNATILMDDPDGSGVASDGIEMCVWNDGTPIGWRSVDKYIPKNGTGGTASAMTTLVKGNNTIQWRATDGVGNGPAYSPVFALVLYNETLEYIDFHPSHWSNRAEIPIDITIAGEGPLEMSNKRIYYTMDADIASLGKEWTEGYLTVQGVNLLASARITVDESAVYHVQWGLSPFGQQEYVLSGVYDVKVDLDTPLIHNISPAVNSIVNRGINEFQFICHDNTSGIDPASGRYRIAFGSTDASELAWDECVLESIGGAWIGRFSIDISDGPCFLQLSVMDIAGNIMLTEYMHYMGNRIFTVVDVRPLNGTTFRVGDIVNFSVSVMDPDNDTISYRWSSSLDGLLGTNSSFATNLSQGMHTVFLSINDLHGHSFEKRITIHILPDDGSGPTTNPEWDWRFSGTTAVWLVLIVATAIIVSTGFYVRDRARRRK